ncbi:hypothetical protein RU01_13815 [Rhodococcus sp. MEB064]|nr:hypothetical protein RU01_13815 [Rhodococcus sp. MEB064]
MERAAAGFTGATSSVGGAGVAAPKTGTPNASSRMGGATSMSAAAPDVTTHMTLASATSTRSHRIGTVNPICSGEKLSRWMDSAAPSSDPSTGESNVAVTVLPSRS